MNSRFMALFCQIRAVRWQEWTVMTRASLVVTTYRPETRGGRKLAW